MDINEIRSIYSPVFTDGWDLLKEYAKDPPKPADNERWKALSDEVDRLAEKHDGCGKLNSRILLAVIEEIERLSKAGN